VNSILAPDVALCTICDWPYLARLLVLVRSLQRVDPALTLHVVCLDEPTRRYLEKRPGIIATAVSEVERGDPEVLATRRFRTQTGYAWTLKPAICLHVLRSRPDAGAVLFLDADLMFFDSPEPIFDELARGSVLLVPERHVAPAAWTRAGGRPDLGTAAGETWGFYNSGTVGFRRDRAGLAALGWWREQCLSGGQDWGAPGARGDQWNLNPVPNRFGGVRIIDHPGVGLAPWNARGTTLECRGAHLLADGRPVVFYHFQSLRLRHESVVSRLTGWRGNDLGRLPGVTPPLRATIYRQWRLSTGERELLWWPYLRELAAAVAEIRGEQPAWADTLRRNTAGEIAGDVVSELSWRTYLAAGRLLPPPARRAVSSLRARARQRFTTRA
jgi:hypothetical protein